MKDTTNTHENFTRYSKSILSSNNFSDIPHKDSWVVANNVHRNDRIEWLIKKKEKIKISSNNLRSGKYAPYIYELHPYKKKPCSICGKTSFLDYIYPTKILEDNLLSLNEYNSYKRSKEYFSIFEYIDYVDENAFKELVHYFNNNLFEVGDFLSKSNFQNLILSKYNGVKNRYFSPGAMSNFPDRLDGYHTYNLCCRSIKDKGRSTSNLKKYTEDRRAYEFLSNGDYKAAGALMGKFQENNISPDHIGPISLGFSHIPYFNKMTQSQNSSKGNRLSLNDVKDLISLEEKIEVASWHIKKVWDYFKVKVNTDAKAVVLGKILKILMDNNFYFFKKIYDLNKIEYLFDLYDFDYSFFKIDIEGFDPETGNYTKIKRTRTDIANNYSHVERDKRIKIDSIIEYSKKLNRRNLIHIDKTYFDNLSSEDLNSKQSLIEINDFYSTNIIEKFKKDFLD